MAKTAPPKVKASLNRLAKAYNGLKGIKLTDASSVKKFTAFGKTMSKDITTVSGYFATNCKG